MSHEHKGWIRLTAINITLAMIATLSLTLAHNVAKERFSLLL